MVLCALCKRHINEHTEGELFNHLKKLSKMIGRGEYPESTR